MKQYFITGTDTDCGKTYVTAQLVKHCVRAAAVKPVASGCNVVDGQLISSDAKILQQVFNLPMDVINPWRFKSPVSPHIAAKEEGKELVLKDLADYCLNLKLDGIDSLFIEGAGGLMVPLNKDESWVDFLNVTSIPVILVVGMRLGCINHALLTQSCMNVNGIRCLGWVANCIDPNMSALQENMDTLSHLLKFPLLGTVPYSQDIQIMQPNVGWC